MALRSIGATASLLIPNWGGAPTRSVERLVVHFATGEKFYGDYDVMGVYEPPAPGATNWVARSLENPDGLRAELNNAIAPGLDVVQHSANDEFWKAVNNSRSVNNANRGAYGLDEKFIFADKDGSVRVVSLDELERIYESRGIPWPLNEWVLP